MPSSSILIPSYRRLHQLGRCLEGIARQTLPPDEVIVVWQYDDQATRDLAVRLSPTFEGRLKVIHCPTTGIVPAENKGLENAKGEIILLIDDDAVAPDNWLANHLKHYDDQAIGAVGGPALNHTPSGERFPVQQVRQIGKLTWYGKLIGNLNDTVLKNRHPAMLEVDSLAGNNMSLRRSAFDVFDEHVKEYWQFFEFEACQQVKHRGFSVIFDLDNSVLHYPASTNRVYDATREGNLTITLYNAAYNHAYILSKWTTGIFRVVRLFYLMTISSVPFPGPIKYPLAVWRYGQPRREFRIMLGIMKSHWKGWRDATLAQKAL
ncbi:MAG: glycosyltransferase [Bryobacteraceae bacterium]